MTSKRVSFFKSMADAKKRNTEPQDPGIEAVQEQDQDRGRGASTSTGLRALFKKIGAGMEQDQDHGTGASSSLQVLFKRMASSSTDDLPDSVDEEMTKRPITSSLVQEVSSKMELASMKTATQAAGKRRYNNARRLRLKKSRVGAGRNMQQSRADAARLKTLVSGTCGCSWETCFSQFSTILIDLIALLTIFGQAAKVVRDEVLRCSVCEQDVGVLGFRLSIKCFCKLFQVSKTVVATLSQGKLHHDDRRMKGRPRKLLPKVQERRIRIYLSTVDCRGLSSSVRI